MGTKRVRRARTSKVLKEVSLSPSPPRRQRAAGTPRRQSKKVETEAKVYWELDKPAFLQSEQRENGQYLLLNWKGVNPATGLKFAPTWVRSSLLSCEIELMVVFRKKPIKPKSRIGTKLKQRLQAQAQRIPRNDRLQITPTSTLTIVSLFVLQQRESAYHQEEIGIATRKKVGQAWERMQQARHLREVFA